MVAIILLYLVAMTRSFVWLMHRIKKWRVVSENWTRIRKIWYGCPREYIDFVGKWS